MADDFFMKIAGIAKGESQDSVLKGDAGWFQIQHFSFGGSNTAVVSSGKSGLGAGKVALRDITIVKYVDTASMPLLQAMCKGNHLQRVTIVARKAGGKVPVDYLTINLEYAMVTNYSYSPSATNPSETVTIAYIKITVDYIAQDEKGLKKVAGTFSWNRGTNDTN